MCLMAATEQHTVAVRGSESDIAVEREREVGRAVAWKAAKSRGKAAARTSKPTTSRT
jgi:hypothetical protein